VPDPVTFDSQPIQTSPTFHTETSNVKSAVVPYAQGTSSPPNGGDVTDVNNPAPDNASSSQGVVFDQVPVQQTSHTPEPKGILSSVGDTYANYEKGLAKGVLQTTSGLGNIIHNVGEYVHPGLGEAIIPQSGLTAEEAYATPHGTAQHIGSGAELVAEFLMGDEAMKGLSMADKYAQIAKTMKMAENSSRLMKALQIGADAARMGVVQGAQTGVKTGGDADAALRSGVVGAGTAGVLGGVGSALGEGASALGNAGKKVQELGDRAAAAAPKGEISSQLADKINSSEDLLKSDYGDKLKDFVSRTKGTTVPYADSPFHNAVQDILGKGESEATPFDEALRKSRPGSARVNQTLEDLDALGKPPEPAEPETWVDNNGVKHTEPVLKMDEPEPVNMDMKTLLGQRALLGERIRQIKGVSSEDLADKQVYGKLMDGVDDTIDTLVGKAKDPEVADEYQDLRQNYREHVNLYQDPVVKAITNPKGAPDDAARAFVGLVNKSGLPQAGKVQQSLATLQKVLDPLGKEGDAPLKQFGHQVFHTMLSDAAPEGHFNASKFMDTWSRIDPATKDKLFDAGPDAESSVAKMATDAQSVRNIQRLTRVGLLSTGGLPFHATGLGAIGLLALINENAGVQAGRNTLDFIANHPAVWKTFRGLGHVAESPTTQAIGEGVQKVATNAAGRATEPDKDKE
jgi:hypothetical protein